MTIKEFILPLKTVLSLGRSQVVAWRNLLSLVTGEAYDWAQDVSSLMSNPQINRILNGDRKISPDYASNILSSDYCPENLSYAIGELELSVREFLAKEYEKYDPEVNAENVNVWCVNKLTTFLTEPMSQENPVRKQAEEKAQHVNFQKKLNHMKTTLLLETGGTCPQLGCNAPLTMKDDNNQNVDNYEIVAIDPSLKLDDESNLIAMCSNCAKKYSGTNATAMQNLLKIKSELTRRRFSTQLLRPEMIENEIKQVIIKLQNFEGFPEQYDEKIDGPLRVKDKIKEDTLLTLNILAHVRDWFKFVHHTLQNLDYANSINFQDIKDIMHYQYKKLARENLTQREIIDSLTEYLHQTTNESTLSCEIIISYFVQDCEVFDATPKQVI